MAELESRSFEARIASEDLRTIVGLAVPYNEDANIGGQYLERFAPGAIQSVEDVKIFYNHNHDALPIGKVIEGRETEAGYEITAELTPGIQAADETLAAMKHGSLNRFSVGFVPLESERDGQTITRKLVSLREVSVVANPAYSGAAIQEIREETLAESITQESESMETNSLEIDVRQAMDEVAELRRDIQALATPAVETPAVGTEFRSAGEYAKAVVGQDKAALELFRAATTSADTVALPGWLGQINDLIENNRPALNAFSKAALPSAGLTVEYAHVSANTLAVGTQDPENEALSFGNIAIDTVSAPVVTKGGYTTYSRQTVERSTVNFLDTAIRALSIQYAKATNAAVVAKLAALDFTGKVFDADGGTAASLIEGIANGAAYINAQTGMNPEFILCSPDAYVTLVKTAAGDGRPVVSTNGDGANTIGSAQVPGLKGQILGLPIIVDAQIGTGLVYLANSMALQTLESAGSPVRLQDGDITTLTDSLSVYGYSAITVPFEGAVVKLDITA